MSTEKMMTIMATDQSKSCGDDCAIRFVGVIFLSILFSRFLLSGLVEQVGYRLEISFRLGLFFFLLFF